MALDVRDRAAGERLMAAARAQPPLRGDRGLREGDLRARSGAARARVSTNDARRAPAASRRRRCRRCSRSSPSAGSSSTCPTRASRSRPTGERVALEVLRHHRLLELYLAEHLGVPWDRVHEEAEALEHVISEDLEARIAAKLGNPTHDPHGDPIPERRPRDRRGRRPRAWRTLEPGARGALRARLGLRPRDAALPRRARHRGSGDALEVVERQPFGGPLTVRFGGDGTCSAAALARRCASSSTRASGRRRSLGGSFSPCRRSTRLR